MWSSVSPLAASLVPPVMSSVVKCICGRGVRRAGKEYMDKTFLVPLYPLNNIKITNYFSNKPRFNGVFLRDDLPRINDEVYVINLDDENIKGKYWISLIADRNRVVYFDSFGIEYIPLEVLKKIRDK